MEYLHRYSSSFYRIETDLNSLISDTKFLVDLSKNKSSEAVTGHLQPLSLLRKFYRKKKPRIPSIKHRLHGNYDLSDIFEIDPELAREIEIVASYFGYKLSDTEINQNGLVESLDTSLARLQPILSTSKHKNSYVTDLMIQDSSDENLFKCFEINNI